MCQSPSTPAKLIAERLISPSNYRRPTSPRYRPRAESLRLRARIASDTIDKLRKKKKKKKRNNRETPRLQLPDPFRASSISLEGNSAVERRRIVGVVFARSELDRWLRIAVRRYEGGGGGQRESGEESNMPRTSRR